MRGPGIFQQKILLLLLSGLTIGLSGSPRRAYQIVRFVGREWEKLNKHKMKRAIRSLYESQLVAEKHEPDGSMTLTLTKEGKRRTLQCKFDELSIKKPHRWDHKWRIVAFDVPEEMKQLRDTLRFRLRQLGFLELQKSIFVFPYPCNDEIDFIIEFYNARKFVRVICAESVDNEFHLKKMFSVA